MKFGWKNVAKSHMTCLGIKGLIDMLHSNSILPIIIKPTRITNYSATLIDHIYYTNNSNQMVSGIATVDISDHLPTKLILYQCRNKNTRYIIDYRQFDSELYIYRILKQLTRILFTLKATVLTKLLLRL